jgi:hypothetical protein
MGRGKCYPGLDDSLIHRHNLIPPQDSLFAPKHRDWRFSLLEGTAPAVDTVQARQQGHRCHRPQALPRTCRRVLVVVWHVLTECVADRKADEEMVAFKLMMWAWKPGKERRGGLTTPQFVRAGLMRLEMGEDLTHIVRAGTVRPIASAEEVLALRAEA